MFSDDVVDMDRDGQGKDRLADDDIAGDIQSMILEGKRCARCPMNMGEWVCGKGVTISQ